VDTRATLRVSISALKLSCVETTEMTRPPMKPAARNLLIGLGSLALAVAVFYVALGSEYLVRLALFAVAVFAAVVAVAAIAGPTIVTGLFLCAITGLLLAGSFWLATAQLGFISVVGFVVAYISWIAFSWALFGTPVIVIPFPPFFIFAWQKLTGQRKTEAMLRCGALIVILFAATTTTNIHRRNASRSERDVISASDSRQPTSADTGMRGAVRAALSEEGLPITNLSVVIDGGRVVRMNGLAQDAATRSRAEEIVTRLPGVTKVVNELRVK